ncbi:MAG: FAD:protein FMN transferase [Candidatus Dormiibacterota bacterium]
MLAVGEERALGTSLRVVTTDASALPAALAAVRAEVAALDESCSRFREDSELSRVNRAGGHPVEIGPLLVEVLGISLDVARATGGAVDPTVGTAMRRVGYDRDFALLEDEPPGTLRLTAHRIPGWEMVELDVRRGRVRVPSGVELDLGSTGKAFAADRAAARAEEAVGGGVLVSLGGDVAVAGPAPGSGWQVLCAEDHATPLDGPGQVVSITSGGLATSSTQVRRWRQGGVVRHHILDPATGLPAREHWRTVTVAAATCVQANAGATAAIVLGDRALLWLQRLGVPARLIDAGGVVVEIGGWPSPGDGA